MAHYVCCKAGRKNQLIQPEDFQQLLQNGAAAVFLCLYHKPLEYFLKV